MPSFSIYVNLDSDGRFESVGTYVDRHYVRKQESNLLLKDWRGPESH